MTLYDPIPDLEQERFEYMTMAEYHREQVGILRELLQERDPTEYDPQTWWKK